MRKMIPKQMTAKTIDRIFDKRVALTSFKFGSSNGRMKSSNDTLASAFKPVDTVLINVKFLLVKCSVMYAMTDNLQSTIPEGSAVNSGYEKSRNPWIRP